VWVPDMFFNFYLAKNHKIVKNSTTTKDREKIHRDSKSSKFQKYFEGRFDKIDNESNFTVK